MITITAYAVFTTIWTAVKSRLSTPDGRGHHHIRSTDCGGVRRLGGFRVRLVESAMARTALGLLPLGLLVASDDAGVVDTGPPSRGGRFAYGAA
jgi:hypothetical protein